MRRKGKALEKCISEHLGQMDLSGDMAAILNSVDSDGYYGMLREQISLHLPPNLPIIAI